VKNSSDPSLKNNITIISLSWNSETQIASQFKFLAESINKNDSALKFTYYCFDNNSNRNRFKTIHQAFTQYKSNKLNAFFHQFPENYGYAKGNDLAIKHVLSSLPDTDIIIINPDITLELHHLQAVINEHNRDSDCVLSLSAIDENANTLYSKIKLTGLNQKNIIVDHEDEVLETDYIPGSFIFIPNKICKQIISRDELFFMHDYFLYWEEVELSIRLKKHGVPLKIINTPKIIRHSNSTNTTTNSIYYFTRNSFKIAQHHTDKISKSDHLTFLLKHLIIFSIKALKEKNFGIIKNYFTGLIHGIRKVSGENPKKITKTTTVSKEN
jgi:GT2 family glycosyltransferase